MNPTAQRYRRGLVVGKFCPLHRGHMLVIQSALDACAEVLVISYTKPEFEGCGTTVREAWITALFPQVRALVIDDASLARLCAVHGISDGMRIPDNDAAAADQREFTGWLCWTVLRTPVDAVFTSEDYGVGLAQALSAYFSTRGSVATAVEHVSVDRERRAVPVSGTAIRADPYGNRAFLAPRVYASLVRRVCLLGGESSGKTSLASLLAERLGTTWVPEFGRELWEEKGGALAREDMLRIAQVQLAREAERAQQAKQWLICDTSALTTACYSLDMFGALDQRLASLAARTYDVTFLCAPDFPFVQDGTRRDEGFRQHQHAWYVSELARRGVRHTVLHGSLEARVATASAVLARAAN